MVVSLRHYVAISEKLQSELSSSRGETRWEFQVSRGCGGTHRRDGSGEGPRQKKEERVRGDFERANKEMPPDVARPRWEDFGLRNSLVPFVNDFRTRTLIICGIREAISAAILLQRLFFHR